MELAEQRAKLGRMVNPVRGIIDATAAVFAMIGSGVLWFAGVDGLSRRASLAIFGITLVCLYTVSTLYHSVPWDRKWKHRMQRADHSMIYVLVAGSYTPFAVIVLSGWIQAVTLTVVWGIAVVGVAQKLFLPGLHNAWAIAMTTTQGWLAIFLLVPLAQKLPWQALFLMVIGGVLYTVGMVFLVTRRPRLWPRVFSHHEAMHVMVVAGSVCHFVVIARFLPPLAI
ncbi:MAG: hemolysin III family protein [Acidimicrobiia bacterium]|nr:hemolysin III family protein [Acidimicrobiia bacterium]